MRAVIVYTASRLVLFAATLGVLYLLGARGLLALALAVLISGLVSFVLLHRQRDALSAVFARKSREVRERIDEGTRTEDEEAADERSEAPPASAPDPSPRPDDAPSSPKPETS